MRTKLFSVVVLLLFVSQLAPAQSIVDNSLPGSGNVNITNWPPATAGRAASGADDFDRPDSASMGPDWTEVAGDADIFNNQGRALSKGYMVHNSIFEDYKVSTLSMDFLPTATGPILIYTALIAAVGTDFLFIKVQDNNSDGLYESVWFYKNDNGGNWGGTGWHYTLVTPTAGGRMHISFDPTGDICYCDLDLDLNGIIDESCQCDGILASGLSLGQGFGIAYYNNEGTFDNWVVNDGGVSFTADTDVIPAKTGGQVYFLLEPGVNYAGMKYLILGSASGNKGIPLPGGGSLPLTWDIFTNLCIDYIGTPLCVDFIGPINASGAAKAKFDTLGPVPPIAVGLTMYFAYTVKAKPWFASNFVEVTIK